MKEYLISFQENDIKQLLSNIFKKYRSEMRKLFPTQISSTHPYFQYQHSTA